MSATRVPVWWWGVPPSCLRLRPLPGLRGWQRRTFLQYGDFLVLGQVARSVVVVLFWRMYHSFQTKGSLCLMADGAKRSFRAHGMSFRSEARPGLLYRSRICVELKDCWWTVCIFFFFGHKGTGWIVSPSSKMTHSSGMGLITLIGEREKDLEGRASSLMAVVPQLSSLLWSSDHPGIGGMGQFQCAGMVFVASAFELWPYFFFFLSRCLQCNPPFVVANSGLMLLEYVVWSLCERVLLISQN